MSIDHDTHKSSDTTTHEGRDRSDPARHEEGIPKASQDHMLREAKKKVVAQASGPPDPKAAHAASDKESIEAARATLNAQAAIVVEAAARIEAVSRRPSDSGPQRNVVVENLARGEHAINASASYCRLVKLDARGWSNLSYVVTGLYRAFERFEAAMEGCYAAFDISRDGDRDTQFMRRTLADMLKTIGHGEVTVNYVGTPPTESSKSLLVIEVRENLEAARAAADSVIAGNRSDLRRLVTHLQHLGHSIHGELLLLKRSDGVTFRSLLGLRKDVLQRLDKLEPAGQFASEEERSSVASFREVAKP
ncbi:MAG: hypothetical protein KF773_11275 [Deltaproteobacteria bacterium]|nr:hypothetical protein [Deltaproteobacteria bacterium]